MRWKFGKGGGWGLFIYFIFTLFTVDLKLLIYTKNLCIASTVITELIDVNSVTEQEMQSFPNQFFKSM